jgi:hypothetical protein
MIFRPRWSLTKTIMTSPWSMIVPGLVFMFFFASAAAIEASSLADLAEKVRFLFTEAQQSPYKMAQLNQMPSYVAQDWIHLLAGDLFIGRYIYMDGLNRRVPTWHSLFITFGGGPLGFVLHAITCAVFSKPAPTEQLEPQD